MGCDIHAQISVPRHPFSGREGGKLNRSGGFVEEKIPLPLLGIESRFVDYRTFSIVATRAELFCLRPWQQRIFNVNI
jgi:hypothetical protein